MENLNVEIKVNGLEFKGEITESNSQAQALFSSLLGGVFSRKPISNVSSPNQTVVPKGVSEAPAVEEPKEEVVTAPADDEADENECSTEEKYTYEEVVELARELAKDMPNESERKVVPDRKPYQPTPKPTGGRKLLMGTCECGEKHFLWIYDNGQVHTFNCRKCKKEHTADYPKLIKADISCPNCNTKSYAYGNGNSNIECTCRNCESPIDLVYNEAKKCFRSL